MPEKKKEGGECPGVLPLEHEHGVGTSTLAIVSTVASALLSSSIYPSCFPPTCRRQHKLVKLM